MKQSTGGPAFPTKLSVCRDTGDLMPHQFGSTDFCATGMSLRDYFAAKAIQALIARGEDDSMRGYEGWGVELGREAYRYADAMLAAREAA